MELNEGIGLFVWICWTLVGLFIAGFVLKFMGEVYGMFAIPVCWFIASRIVKNIKHCEVKR